MHETEGPVSGLRDEELAKGVRVKKPRELRNPTLKRVGKSVEIRERGVVVGVARLRDIQEELKK